MSKLHRAYLRRRSEHPIICDPISGYFHAIVGKCPSLVVRALQGRLQLHSGLGGTVADPVPQEPHLLYLPNLPRRRHRSSQFAQAYDRSSKDMHEAVDSCM